MESFLLIVVIAIALIRWIYLRQRLSEMSARIDAVSRMVVQVEARAARVEVALARQAEMAPPPARAEQHAVTT
ncbi:MAG TPA: hypothetical protein VGZ73_15590, partial [Bryobacteraceae bacterium]|nr:hypothetical protein [Bryobacteraceae bacterium]